MRGTTRHLTSDPVELATGHSISENREIESLTLALLAVFKRRAQHSWVDIGWC